MKLQFSILFRSLRPRQWIKNVLVIAAPFAAGEIFEAGTVRALLLAFVAFCAASSTGYLVNDWLDREIDREHPVKKSRPFASGELKLTGGLSLIVILVLTQVIIEMQLPIEFAYWINAYLALTFSYSLFFKKIPVVEMALVSFGFLLRPLAGAAAVEVMVSEWFLIVVGFASLFLVATKRLAELKNSKTQTLRCAVRQYTENFLQTVVSVAISATLTGYGLWAFGVLVENLWVRLSVLPVSIGLLRYLWRSERGEAEMPEKLLFSDSVILICGAITVLMLGKAIYL